MPDDVSLDIFCSGLNMKSALDHDFPAGFSFAHTSPTEGRAILDSLLENSFFPSDHSESRQKESTSTYESFSTPGSKLSSFIYPYSSVEPSPEPRTSEGEEIQPPEFSSQFEGDPSGNNKNTSNFFDAQLGEEPFSVHTDQSQNLLTRSSPSPMVLPSIPDLPNKLLLEEAMKKGWSDGARHFSEDVWISSPSMIIPAQ